MLGLASCVIHIYMKFQIARASQNDVADILKLYQSAYTGNYPDRNFSSPEQLSKTLTEDNKFVFIALNSSQQLVASIIFYYDHEHRLARAGAAVVDPAFRGNNITQKIIQHGIEHLLAGPYGLEVLYITTRTVHKAAQVLTERMGFKQLGIFPNVHKTNDYETHALAAMYLGEGLKRRHQDFEQHPDVSGLFEIVRENIQLEPMPQAEIWAKKHYDGEVPLLEVINEAPVYIQKRYQRLKKNENFDLAFFPFHQPNLWITSPGENIEVYAYVNEVDKHCVITGCKIDREVSFTQLFLKVSHLLRDRGIRYIEVILRANRINILDKIIQAKFIPCGYLPAFQLQGDKRYDYVVFSRSYEILDFNNLQLTGANEKYLRNYINLWESKFLGSYFKNDNG